MWRKIDEEKVETENTQSTSDGNRQNVGFEANIFAASILNLQKKGCVLLKPLTELPIDSH